MYKKCDFYVQDEQFMPFDPKMMLNMYGWKLKMFDTNHLP